MKTLDNNDCPPQLKTGFKQQYAVCSTQFGNNMTGKYENLTSVLNTVHCGKFKPVDIMVDIVVIDRTDSLVGK